MKALMIFSLLIVVTACGKGGSGGGGQNTQSQNPVTINCKSVVKKADLLEAAASANRARKECNLSEDEAVEYVARN